MNRLRHLAARSPAATVAAARGRVRMVVWVLALVAGLIVIGQPAAVVNLSLARWDPTRVAVVLTAVWWSCCSRQPSP